MIPNIFLSATAINKTYWLGDILYLRSIFIEPVFRGQGLARIVTERLIDYYKPAAAFLQPDSRVFFLDGNKQDDPLAEVSRQNGNKKLVKLYTSWGFKKWKRSKFMFISFDSYGER